MELGNIQKYKNTFVFEEHFFLEGTFYLVCHAWANKHYIN